MRVILFALALCALAFALNLIGDFSSTTSDAAAPVAMPLQEPARAEIEPAPPIPDAESVSKD